jgi:hypothetical protein
MLGAGRLLHLPPVDPVGEIPDVAALENSAGTVRASGHGRTIPRKPLTQPLHGGAEKAALAVGGLQVIDSLVRMIGLEPTLPRGNRNLNPARLPISPHPQTYDMLEITMFCLRRTVAVLDDLEESVPLPPGTSCWYPHATLRGPGAQQDGKTPAPGSTLSAET